MEDERKTIGIVLIGLAKTGKTTILNHLCGKQPSDDYTLTVDETHEDATITVDNVTYAISVVDYPGKNFVDSRTTTNQFFSKGNIFFYVGSQADQESTEYLQGIMKESEEIKDCVNVAILTYKDKDVDGAAKEYFTKGVPETFIQIEINAMSDKQIILDTTMEAIRRLKTIAPDKVNGTEVKGGNLL